MLQLRGEDDPWAATAPEQPDVLDAFKSTAVSVGSSFKQMFSPSVAVTTQPTPTTAVTTTFPVPTTPGYTKIGSRSYPTWWLVVGALASAFVGWKYVLPKIRKK